MQPDYEVPIRLNVRTLVRDGVGVVLGHLSPKGVREIPAMRTGLPPLTTSLSLTNPVSAHKVRLARQAPDCVTQGGPLSPDCL